MRFIKTLIIGAILVVPGLIVKADKLECGTYIKEGDSSRTVTVYIEDGRLKTEYWYVAERVTECPENIYEWYCTFPDGAITYRLTESDNAWPCQDWGHYTRKEKQETEIPVDPSNKYDDIVSCRDSGYKYIKECGCMPAALTDITSRLYMLLKIAAPALLLIIGGFEMIKAMSAQDEKGIKKAQQKLLKKFIAAAAIFLIFTIVQVLVNTFAANSKNIISCIDYLLNGYNV